jgi:hypothetical protein
MPAGASSRRWRLDRGLLLERGRVVGRAAEASEDLVALGA